MNKLGKKDLWKYSKRFYTPSMSILEPNSVLDYKKPETKLLRVKERLKRPLTLGEKNFIWKTFRCRTRNSKRKIIS